MGNQSIAPCISAISEEVQASNQRRTTNSPRNYNENGGGGGGSKLLNRIIGIAASNLFNSNSNNKNAFGFGSGGNDLGNLIVKQVQEKVLDYIKDQVVGNPNNGIPGFSSNNLLIKLSQFLRPADNSLNKKSVYNFGERGSGFRAKSINAIQDFEKLQKKYLQLGELFEDPAFPASPQSLYFSQNKGGSKFEWKRPSELVHNPKFIVKDASRFDVLQGELGDCWLLAAIANLTLQENLFKVVVPHNQSFDDNYAGIFHFRFWQYGKWIDVVIDDRLPTINNKLMFVHSESKNEFWSALLEKAYAKLHGSYEALKGGSFGEAVEDFTGGLAEFYDLQSKECPENLYNLMKKAFDRNSFMGCSINALSPDQTEMKLQNGIVMGHAYSITDFREVHLNTSRVKGKIPLLQIFNPWGNEVEWKGAWSDHSREWSLVSEEEKSNINLEFKPDGAFWMSFQDFKTNFTNLEICNLGPEPLHDDDNESIIGADHSKCKKHWEETIFEGSWISGVSAGGCRNYLETYALNPQFLITLIDEDEDDDRNNCTLIVALMQKNRRAKRKMGLDTLTIGFAIYEIKHNVVDSSTEPLATAGYVRKQLLTTEFFMYNASVARSPNFINLREVTARFKLPKGRYCIIPSTFEPNEEGEFLLRIYTEKKPKDCCENDNEIGIVTDYDNIDAKQNEIDDSKFNNFDNQFNEKEQDIVSVDPDVNLPKEKKIDSQITAKEDDVFSLILKLLSPCLKICQINHQPKSKFNYSLDNLEQASDKTPTAVQNFFSKIAGDNMEIGAEELQEILNVALKKEYKFDGFSLESCQSMVAIQDTDRSGKLGLDEFVLLWKEIKYWCEIFKKHDKDNNHLMNASELRDALLEAKLSPNRMVLQTLVLRYGHITSGKKNDVKVERSLTFDRFIMCCTKVKHCIELWSNEIVSQNIHSKEGETTSPTFTLDKFIDSVMYS